LDNNNIIEYEEFLRVMVSPEKILNLNNLKMAFEFFDKDHSGHISKQEVFMALGLSETNPEHMKSVEEIFEQADTDKDGEISFDEFTELMNLFSLKQK
jgi:calcium-dependent protein kinase